MIARLKIEAEDFLRYNPTVRNTLARYKIQRAARSEAPNTRAAIASLRDLCAAARLASDGSLVLQAESAIERVLNRINPAEIVWEELLPDPASRRISKGMILKPYVSEREKGVVFVSFENQMARLAKATDLARFASRYTLVVSPSWCPPHSVYTYLFPRVYPDKIITLISNTKDLTYFPRMDSKYSMLPLYASNWVDDREFRPVPKTEKNIDIFMLANFAKYKRHYAFFRALQDVPRSFRIVLNGQSEPGRSRETILDEAGAYGVRDRFELRENVTDQELHDNLVHAKTSVILSLREGSCVAVVEAMFANTPVGMLEHAEIGSRVFITPETGRLLKPAALGAQLTDFVNTSHAYEPRRWVEENGVGCLASSATLNDTLKREALSAGRDWTEDIAPLRWRPNPQFYRPEDAARMQEAHADIEACGLLIGPAAQ
ncbi:glycosyltransferase [Terriglobus roseus]|uniref:Glycosyl transferases group 1 n=1 Tax=Terriglobus roseus TaxID=392734 RepID=A0A1H4JPA2_9BACT|nr:glycosyltransferase [Terriglobus roseus]SEB47442.1 Glycosyl transferases group 1 [Terriglobus roseus]